MQLLMRFDCAQIRFNQPKVDNIFYGSMRPNMTLGQVFFWSSDMFQLLADIFLRIHLGLLKFLRSQLRFTSSELFFMLFNVLLTFISFSSFNAGKERGNHFTHSSKWMCNFHWYCTNDIARLYDRIFLIYFLLSCM